MPHCGSRCPSPCPGCLIGPLASCPPIAPIHFPSILERDRHPQSPGLLLHHHLSQPVLASLAGPPLPPGHPLLSAGSCPSPPAPLGLRDPVLPHPVRGQDGGRLCPVRVPRPALSGLTRSETQGWCGELCSPETLLGPLAVVGPARLVSGPGSREGGQAEVGVPFAQ